MANTVMVLTRVQADNIDALNRVAKLKTEDLPNGAPVTLTFPKEGEGDVFTAAKATEGLKFSIGRKEPIIIGSEGIGGEEVDAWLLEVTENTSNVWLVYSPEVNKQVVGMIWGGKDPRNFTNIKNKPFDVFKPQVGDIIQVSKDFFETSYDPATVSSSTKVELTSGKFQAKV